MGKFLNLISDSTNATLKRRATSIASNAEIAQQNIINTLKQKKSELELKIMDLTDLAPETMDSLRPGSKNWDPSEWAIKLQQTKEELYELKISLKIAEETYNEYFK